MGINSFRKWLRDIKQDEKLKLNSNLIFTKNSIEIKKEKEEIKEKKEEIEKIIKEINSIDYLLIDTNSILHQEYNKIKEKYRKLEENLEKELIKYICNLIRDGVENQGIFENQDIAIISDSDLITQWILENSGKWIIDDSKELFFTPGQEFFNKLHDEINVLKIPLTKKQSEEIHYLFYFKISLDSDLYKKYEDCDNKKNKIYENLEKDIIDETIMYICKLIEHVSPKKEVYISIDGVPPVAKIIEQRNKRYVLDNSDIWDTNAITPGTVFMEKLDKEIKDWGRKQKDIGYIINYSSYKSHQEGEHKLLQFIREKVNVNKDYKYLVYSPDADLFMLTMITSSDNIYILIDKDEKIDKDKNVIENINMEDYSEYFSIKILKECLKEIMNNGYKNCLEVLKNKVNDIDKDLNEILKNDKIFMYYLKKDDFITKKRELNKEKLINDFIVLCFLVGNDFLPKLLNIYEYGIERRGFTKLVSKGMDKLIKVYIEVFINLVDQYLFNDNIINVEFFKKIIDKLSYIDNKQFKYFSFVQSFMLRCIDQNLSITQQFELFDNFQNEILYYYKDKSYNKDSYKDINLFSTIDFINFVTNYERTDQDELKKHLEEIETLELLEEYELFKYLKYKYNIEYASDANKSPNINEQDFKKEYYKYYFNCNDDEDIKNLVENYLMGIKWVTLYYFDKCPSWQDWSFPYKKMPLLEDLKKYLNDKSFNIVFTEGVPLKPFEQLLYVLPRTSKELLPESLKECDDVQELPDIKEIQEVINQNIFTQEEIKRNTEVGKFILNSKFNFDGEIFNIQTAYKQPSSIHQPSTITGEMKQLNNNQRSTNWADMQEDKEKEEEKKKKSEEKKTKEYEKNETRETQVDEREKYKPYNIYLMCHAEPENTTDIDSELSEKGLLEAQKVTKNYLQHLKIDCIISSPFISCIQTAGLVKNILKEEAKLYIEIQLRKMWNKKVKKVKLKNKDEISRYKPNVILKDNDYNYNGITYKIENNESKTQDNLIDILEFNQETKLESKNRFIQIFEKIIDDFQNRNLLIICDYDMIKTIIKNYPNPYRRGNQPFNNAVNPYCSIIGYEYNREKTQKLRIIVEL